MRESLQQRLSITETARSELQLSRNACMRHVKDIVFGLLACFHMTGCSWYEGRPGQFREFHVDPDSLTYSNDRDEFGGWLINRGFMPLNVTIANVRSEPLCSLWIDREPIWSKDHSRIYFSIRDFSKIDAPVRICADIMQDGKRKQVWAVEVSPLPLPSLRGCSEGAVKMEARHER